MDIQITYVGFEIDKGYYDAANQRLEDHKAQIDIFACGVERI